MTADPAALVGDIPHALSWRVDEDTVAKYSRIAGIEVTAECVPEVLLFAPIAAYLSRFDALVSEVSCRFGPPVPLNTPVRAVLTVTESTKTHGGAGFRFEARVSTEAQAVVLECRGSGVSLR
ncbi:hypothetical protein [Nocardia asteroides]